MLPARDHSPRKEFRVRRATVSDCYDISTVFSQARSRRRATDPTWSVSALDESDLNLVVEAFDRIVGFATLRKAQAFSRQRHSAEITTFVIEPGAAEKDIGAALLEAMIEEARHVSRLQIYVCAGATGTLGCLEAAGFVVEGKLGKFFSSERRTCDALIMARIAGQGKAGERPFGPGDNVVHLSSAPKLSVSLFGLFEARVNGEPLHFSTRKVELLLAILALNLDKALSRSSLAALIWPGQPDAQARASLRQAVFRLRALMAKHETDALEVTQGWLKLKRGAVLLDLDTIVSAGGRSVMAGLPLDGLTGFEPDVEDLLNLARADLTRQHVLHLREAAEEAIEQRRFSEAEGFARQHLSLEPFDETALRMLMTCLWRQGRRNAALSLFREVSQRIRSELSVAVEDATVSLFEAIRKSGALSDAGAGQRRLA